SPGPSPAAGCVASRRSPARRAASGLLAPAQAFQGTKLETGKSKLEIRNSTGDSRFSIFEFRFSTSWRFSSLTYAPCFKPLSLEFCLAAGLRGPVECWAFWRAAASSAGVSWGDLRKDMVPPETGCWDSEERTSPRV